MTKQSFSFSSAVVNYFFESNFSYLERLAVKGNTILITDENVFAKHKSKLSGWKIIVLHAGEEFKTHQTVEAIIRKLISYGADRNTTLVGVGGGVTTDVTGYVAGIYMRGIKCGFIPTTLLAMVDASIGGKNGVNVDLYKNMAGLIRQPSFVLYDYSFLKTLPQIEWQNGFAEIIKHACVKDVGMFKKLEENKLVFFKKDVAALAQLIRQNVLLKSKIVVRDELENGERKLLNFGHTVGHAIENLYSIPHGHAVGIGMGVACKVSEKLTGFRDTPRVIKLLKLYGLPPEFEFDKKETFKILSADKKREGENINYIVLEKIGKASMVSLPLNELFNHIGT